MDYDWKLVTPDMMTLRDYPCGISAGDVVRLRADFHICDYKGRPTGEMHKAGETCLVLPGNPAEPNVIWLRWSDGEDHTWDETILESFELLVDKGT